MRQKRSAAKAFAGIAAAAMLLTGCASTATETAESSAAGNNDATGIPGESITLTVGAGHPAGGAITYAN